MITPQELRDLEAGAAPATSKAIRQALRSAAEALESRENGADLTQWVQLGQDAAAILEEMGNQHVSQTMTEHRAAELMQEDRRQMVALAARFRELLGA